MLLAAGYIGGVFRVQDGLNYYYVVLDRSNGSTRVGAVINGVGLANNQALRTYNWPGGVNYKRGQTFDVSTQMNEVGFLVYVRVALCSVRWLTALSARTLC